MPVKSDGNAVMGDPENKNDNFRSNLITTLKEAEAYLIAERTRAIKFAKAQVGEYRVNVPAGFIWTGTKQRPRIEKDPDIAVRNAVAGVFDLLDRLGSACSVLRYMHDNNLLYPSKRINKFGAALGEYAWVRMNLNRLMHIFHSPVFAGSYMFGYRGRGGKIHIPNHHEGYIDWQQFVHNQKLLHWNRSH